MEVTLTALIFGSTGAVGRQVVNHMLNSPKWKKIIVVVRNPLPEWSQHPQKSKLQIQVHSNMDDLLQPEKFKFENVDVVITSLGSQIKHGDQIFVKVDKTYPLKAGDIALQNKIPQYILVSSMSANSSSCFLFPRTKGQTEDELKLKKLPLLTIFRPGLLRNRHEARFTEKLVDTLCGCCIPKIEAVDCAQVLMITAERDYEKSRTGKQQFQLYQNGEMLQIHEKRTQQKSKNSKQESSRFIK